MGGLKFTYLLGGLSILIAIIMAYSLVAPFHPMHVEDTVFKPDTVCPSELVGIDGNTTLTKGRFHIVIDPLWMNVADEEYLDEAAVDGDIKGPLKDEDARTELVYSAPPEPGLWLLRFEIEIQGRTGILPRTQSFTVTTKTPLNVVDCGDTYEYTEKKSK